MAQTQTLRLMGGRHARRRIEFPRGAKAPVRPTSALVREALFTLLGERVRGAAALDLCAGSGALGLEALSRGAARCTFVDNAAACTAAIRRNAALLGESAAAEVLRLNARAALARLAKRGAQFNLVLADPPYQAGLAADLLQRLAVAGVLRAGAQVALECAARFGPPPPPAALAPRAQKRYGDTLLCVYEFAPPASG